ncbi:ABC transporter ATP-binding protein [Yeguia hominis]|uniref:ABC transporter ATP-binding protein n=1 Tax=Yeguia hominis TaxID=2763662 RepID=A0A926D8Q9_9FIRM|nr:ABC transporter ATP-binding protein [Yeguia hominis]MBC8532889.1 ABC transporter ATP-binding protein [Yeguia hominis]
MASAIIVKDLHIRYKSFKSFSIKKALLMLGRNKVDTFESVRGVSFEVEEGSIVGIIGKNGSGKSTLLRSIAGIFSPDSGSIETFGHSISLLSIGVGFQKKLSGKENIFLSGLLLGFTEKQVAAKMDEIIEFSGLGEFINKPVKTYSSGMYSKLAFSITAVLEPEIMLIDEVLSVGDEKFQKKSYNKMKELISDSKRTVVIVSHSLNTVKKLCNRVIWLHEGKIKMQGDPDEVISAYKAFMA